jgi:hypothetical protein
MMGGSVIDMATIAGVSALAPTARNAHGVFSLGEAGSRKRPLLALFG